MNETIPLLNPLLDSENLIRQTIFLGGKLNQWIVNQITKLDIFNSTQSSVLLVIIYMILLYVFLTILKEMRKPVKILIISLIIYLIIGFFG